MKNSKEVTIDGKKYRFEPHLTSKGFLLLKNLTAVMGPGVLGLIAAVPKGTNLKDAAAIMSSDISMEKVAESFGTMFAKLDDATADKLMRDVLSDTFYNNTPILELFESHFSGEYKHLLKVMFQAVEYEYGDFLGAVTGGVVKRQAPLTVREEKTA